MGAWIDFSSNVTIGNRSFTSGAIREIAYTDLNDKLKEVILTDRKVQTIQIHQSLPQTAFEMIDSLFAERPDITFRIFGLEEMEYFDFHVLTKMNHLTKLRLDSDLWDNQKLLDLKALCRLKYLRELTLSLFDLEDYSFIQGLNKNLESLGIFADTIKSTPFYDCKWLLGFSKLHTLYLGKKAKKNIKYIADLPNLKVLSVRGIKMNDFTFLQKTGLESLSILWCGVGDLNSLSVLKKLKHLELWRIPKLDDISVINNLENLESLTLQDLSHIHELPDMSDFQKLRELTLINTPIDESSIPERICIRHW